MQVMRRSNEDRSRETTAGLLEAARDLFVAHGFAGTSTPMIVEQAGTTRGALYHHFADKKALFKAVLDREAERVATAIEASETDAAGLSAIDGLLRGADAYLEAMQVEGRTRLLLVEGPAVLGAPEMAEIDRQHARKSLELGLREHIGDAAIERPSLEALTDLLSSMFDRAALALAEGAPTAPYRDAIELLLVGLAPVHQNS